QLLAGHNDPRATSLPNRDVVIRATLAAPYVTLATFTWPAPAEPGVHACFSGGLPMPAVPPRDRRGRRDYRRYRAIGLSGYRAIVQSPGDLLEHLGDEGRDRRPLAAGERDMREQRVPLELFDDGDHPVVPTDA